MEFSLLGYLYTPIALWCFVQRSEKHLLSLLLVSTVLQAASVVNIKIGTQAHGLNPFICTVGLLALKMLPKLGTFIRVPLRSPSRPGKWLLAYLLWAMVATLLMPLLFEGVQVRSPYDAYSDVTEPLRFSLVNVWQIVSLCTVAVVFAFPAVCGVSQDHLKAGIKQGLLMSFLLVALANLYEQLAHANGFPSLVRFWASNAGYNQWGAVFSYGWHARVGVPFSEPSYASAYLVSFIGGVLMLLNRNHGHWQVYIAFVLALLVLLSTGGSTGLVALGVLVTGYWLHGVSCVAHDIFRGKLDVLSLQWIFSFLGFFLIGLVLLAPALFGPKMHAYFSGLIFGKLDINNSGTLARLNADFHGFHLLKETYGLGVGLGSNRTSSFLSSMLGSIGLIGVLLFFGFVYHLIRDYTARYFSLSGLQLFALGALPMMLLPLCLSIPDLNLPVMWAALWVMYALRPSVRA